MEGRHGEVGRSKGRSGMGRIEHAIWLNVKTWALLCLGEARAHVRQVFRCERIWRTFADGKAKYGFGRCTQRRRDEMGQGRLEPGPARSQKAAGAYRKGCAPWPHDRRYAVGVPNKGILLECLSRNDGKLSRTVLRGTGGRKAPWSTRYGRQ